MIHSLSGGIIGSGDNFTFVKVELDGIPCWFLSPFSTVKEGDRVIVPYGKQEIPRETIVLRVEEATAQCAPVPMNRVKEIYGIQ